MVTYGQIINDFSLDKLTMIDLTNLDLTKFLIYFHGNALSNPKVIVTMVTNTYTNN